MAQRRMFSPQIVTSEEFLSMPVSSQALYFQLGMGADDDGFIQPRIVMRMIGSNDDDLRVLLSKRFLLAFEGGVVVIKHWLIHNLIQKDRYHPTRFVEEKKRLLIKGNKAYTESDTSVNKMLPEVRLGKGRLNEEDSSSLEEESPLSQEFEENTQIVPVDENGEEVTTGAWGRPLNGSPKVAREGKNKIAIRIQQKFIALCKKETGIAPVQDIKGYKIVLYAMSTGGLSEPQIYDLFDEWFSLGKPDDEMVQITRALSGNQINGYKARNHK